MIISEQDTAVVILSYNSKKWHELFLPKIVAEAHTGYDVIVVDNASTDDTRSYVQTQFPTVKTLRIPINKGFSYGYHEALLQIQAKYYILLSADFEVTTHWFPPLLHAMQQYEGLAALQPKIRYWKEKEYFEYAGAAGGFIDSFGYLFCRGRLFDTLEKDIHQYDDDVEISWASGGCLMVRADLYHKVGGLDKDMYAHMEEVDLCWRLRNAGYKIGYIGGATVFHVGGSVISYGSPQKLYYNFRNSLVLLIKNESGMKLLWLFPLRLFLDGVAGIQLLLKGKWKDVLVIIKAHFSFYANIGKWIKKRKEADVTKVLQNKSSVYQKSIVWDYFALRKKTFDKISFKPKRLT